MPEGICYGQTDTDVAGSFKSESAAIAEKFKDLSFDLIYTSPLKRCIKLAGFLGNTFVHDERLAEMNFGNWEGIAWDSIFSTSEGKDWFANYTRVRCRGGESFQDLIARVSSFLTEISAKQGNILVVTHAGVMRAMLVSLGLAAEENVFGIAIPFGCILKIAKQYEYKIDVI